MHAPNNSTQNNSDSDTSSGGYETAEEGYIEFPVPGFFVYAAQDGTMWFLPTSYSVLQEIDFL